MTLLCWKKTTLMETIERDSFSGFPPPPPLSSPPRPRAPPGGGWKHDRLYFALLHYQPRISVSRKTTASHGDGNLPRLFLIVRKLGSREGDHTHQQRWRHCVCFSSIVAPSNDRKPLGLFSSRSEQLHCFRFHSVRTQLEDDDLSPEYWKMSEKEHFKPYSTQWDQ